MDLAGALRSVKPVSPRQFALFRAALGLYLALHFAQLLPYGAELFSREGAFGDPRLSPLYGLFPNLLAHFDAPAHITAFLWLLVAGSLLFAAGVARRALAVALWYGWTCLFNRDPLISNPGLPYVGLILLLSALVPPGEGLKPAPGWAFPRQVYNAAFFLLMLGYTFSGLAKLASPSWLSGDALGLLADNPLARPGWPRDILKSLPPSVLRLMTWGALAAEILALPLCLWRRGRPLAWAALLGMHFGILSVIAFADLTLGMLMVHLFTLDPEWFPPARAGRRVVFFDGVCALCDGFVSALMEEDRAGALLFAPLQGKEAQSLGWAPSAAPRSILYARGGELLSRSSAVLAILDDVGGAWRPISWLGRLLPRPLRDLAYDGVAGLRYRVFGKYESCRLPRPGEAGRMLD